MSTFWNPFNIEEKKREQYLKWLKKHQKKNKDEVILNPLPYMPTFVELTLRWCPIKIKNKRHALKGRQTLMYNSPNTITCDKCGHKTLTRWIRINDNHIGAEVFITSDKPFKSQGELKELQ